MLGSEPDTQTDWIFLFSRIFSVPVIQGVNDDAQFRAFIEKYYVGSANSSTVDRILAAYPVDPDFVSRSIHPFSPQFAQHVLLGLAFRNIRYPVPGIVCIHAAALFRTDTYSPASPQYKRLAAFQGDFIVSAARRTMLEAVSRVQGAFVWRTCYPAMLDALRLLAL